VRIRLTVRFRVYLLHSVHFYQGCRVGGKISDSDLSKISNSDCNLSKISDSDSLT